MNNYNILQQAYLVLIHPEEMVREMTYDEFVDWVELGTKEDIECAIEEFRKYNLDDHVTIMEIVIARKSYQKI